MVKDQLYIFFDTETTGLVDHKRPPGREQPDGTHLVQLAAVLTDENFNELMHMDMLVHPGERYDVMPKIPLETHGFTVEHLRKHGLPLETVLGFFSWMCQQAGVAVCHNVSFDMTMVETEAYRTDVPVPIPDVQFCSMKSTESLCKLPGRYGYKWPKLQELYYFLFGKNFEDAHNALVDIRRTIECVQALKERNLVLIP